MAIEEAIVQKQIVVEQIIIDGDKILKPIELKNIGFLQKQPTFVNCPACEFEALSLVRLEPVTILQRLLSVTRLFKKFERRADINHYCSKCGCFIGRYVAVVCTERCLSKWARRKAAQDEMVLKTKPRECAQECQKIREIYKVKQAEKKAAKEASQTSETAAGEVEADLSAGSQ